MVTTVEMWATAVWHFICVSLQVTRSFLNNSIYSNMLPLFVGQTVIFVSKEPKVKEMLQALRRSPQMVLLGECAIYINLHSKKLVLSHRLSETLSFRCLYREHIALVSRHSQLLQTPVYDHYPGWASWWSNHDDLTDCLDATTPSSSSFCPPSAVCQTAGLWGRHKCHYK